MSSNPSNQPTIRPQQRPGPMPIDQVAQRFPQLEVLEVLGQGGMGVVYKARQRGLDREVALKLLPPEIGADPTFAERFGREARALARLQHPNIVMVHDCGEADGLYYLLMEYVDGVNLRRVMDGGRIEAAKALSVVSQVCSALEYAHEEGVVHRDIKPENILMDTRGRVKIADFGLVKLVTGRGTDLSLTAPQQIMGTMHYMAPEQVERPTEVDHRADIYSLGVVLYEVLTGELPIGRFPLPSEKAAVDQRLDHIVLHALEKEPSRRYQRISEVKTDVDALSGVQPEAALGTATPLTPTPAALASRQSWIGQPAAPASPAAPHASSVSRPAGYPVRSTPLAYALWLCCVVGACGVHRMYAGKWITGILWLLTGGLFFIGQFIDLFLIPGMIRMANLESALMAEAAGRPSGVGSARA
ncbi:MAG: protein kinase domain-containing protein [Planctomycetota bacterium]